MQYGIFPFHCVRTSCTVPPSNDYGMDKYIKTQIRGEWKWWVESNRFSSGFVGFLSCTPRWPGRGWSGCFQPSSTIVTSYISTLQRGRPLIFHWSVVLKTSTHSKHVHENFICTTCFAASIWTGWKNAHATCFDCDVVARGCHWGDGCSCQPSADLVICLPPPLFPPDTES